MAGKENLVPKAHSLTVEEQSAGGKKSAATRRANADIRKMLSAALFEEYTDKNTGKKVIGIQGIVDALLRKSLSAKDKDQLATIKYIFNLLGLDKTDTEIAKDEAEIDYIRAKISQMQTSTDNSSLDKLDDILSEMKANANTESETE